MTGPCDWPLLPPEPGEDGCEPCDALTRLSEDRRAQIEAMAVELLWAWSGRLYGTCETTVRPCRAECPPRASTFWGASGRMPSSYGGGWMPVLVGGQWYNLGCGCFGPCSCRPDTARIIDLPGSVSGVTRVMIGGEELTPNAYRLEGARLYRVDGGVWPACNDEIADLDAPDSPAWGITYRRGVPVPAGGQIAGYRLACELAKAACGDNDCALPTRLQSITRQGVSVAVLDGFENLDEGRTGIWEIDAWLASVTFQRSSPPAVYTPDLPAGFQRGTLRGTGFGGRR